MTEVARDSGGPSWHAKLEEGEAGGRRLLRRFGRRFTPLFTMAAEAAVAVSYCHYTTADNSGKSEADLRLPPLPPSTTSTATMSHNSGV